MENRTIDFKNNNLNKGHIHFRENSYCPFSHTKRKSFQRNCSIIQFPKLNNVFTQSKISFDNVTYHLMTGLQVAALLTAYVSRIRINSPLSGNSNSESCVSTPCNNNDYLQDCCSLSSVLKLLFIAWNSSSMSSWPLMLCNTLLAFSSYLFLISQRGLSGMNTKPRNWIKDGIPASPNIYLNQIMI